MLSLLLTVFVVFLLFFFPRSDFGSLELFPVGDQNWKAVLLKFEKTAMILPRLFPRGVTLSNPTSLGFDSFICGRSNGSLSEPSSSY